MSFIKYSILIVTYNRAELLKKCLDSIENQTYKKFEIIVVDDGSTDNTKEIVEQYKNIRYFYKENTGVSDSRNYAISKVKTDYFLFVDSDDYISSDLLEECEKYSDYDVLSFKAIKVDSNFKQIEKLDKVDFNLIDGKSALEQYMKKKSYYIVPWGYVYKTSFFRKNKFKYNENYVNEDFGLVPIVLFNAKKVISIDYFGYYCVQSDESITRTKDKNKILHGMQSQLYNYDYLLDYFKNNVHDKKLLEFYLYIFTRSLLWYGTKFEKEYREIYIKELKKKNLIKNIKFKGFMGHVQKILCRIDYGFYYDVYINARNIRDKIKGKRHKNANYEKVDER